MQISVPKPIESLVLDPFAAQREVANLDDRKHLELLEALMLKCEQVDCPIEHVFAPGVYMRQARIPAGTVLIGHMHHTEHLNIVFSGRLTIVMEGVPAEVTGPSVFKSKAHVRKLIYAHEDSVLANIHPTTETDVAKLEEQLVVHSDTYDLFHEGMKSDMMRLAESLIAQQAALESRGH